MTDSWNVTHICTGKAVPFRGDEKSAFAKSPVDGPVAITTLGIEGDEQADRKVHGGPHMAVHLYPRDHHVFWREEIGDHGLLGQPGAFGSNLSVAGLTEEQVCIGDRFRLGSALLEISQPRQPCWKIEHRFGLKGMVATILKTGRCGWYLRIIEEGTAQTGDTLEKVGSGVGDWTVARVFTLLWGDPKAASRTELQALAELETLTPRLREKAAARLD